MHDATGSCEHGSVKRPFGLSCHTTTMGHFAVLPAIVFAFTIQAGNGFGSHAVVYGGLGFDGIYLALSSTGLLLVVYVAWLLLVMRRIVTAATGGGLTLAAHALVLRAVAGCGESAIPTYARIYLPGRPIFTDLDVAYGLATVVYVLGLAFVVASCLAERQLRREAPDWAVPE